MALPFHKLLQTLNSGSSIGSAAVAILASYGTDAHIYLPGIGTLNGYTLGNYLDSGGVTPATVDNPVGLVQDAIGSIHVSQGTTASKPILRKPSNNYYWEFDGSNDTLVAGSAPFQMADDQCVIVGTSMLNVGVERYPFVVRNAGNTNPWACCLALTASSPIQSYWRDDSGTLFTANSGSTYIANTPIVASARKVGNNKVCRVNGVSGGVNPTAIGATATLDMTRLGSFTDVTYLYNGAIYTTIAIKGTVSDADLLILERWVGSLTGPTGVVIP